MRWDARGLGLAVALAGCGELDLPDFNGTDWTTDLPDPTLSPATLTTSASATSATTAPSTTSTATDTASTSTGTDGGESSTGDLPGSVCNPQPEDVHSGVIVDGMIGWEHEHTELTTPCVVTWVGTVGTALHLGLACDDGAHTLDVADVGPSALATGDLVELSLYIDVPWWANVYAVVRRNGEVMVAAMVADALPGDGDDDDHPPGEFFAPLQVLLLGDVCPLEPIVAEPCDFICSDPCTQDRRQALAFLDDPLAEVIFDHGSGQLGDTAIAVGEAIEHVEVFCVDTAGAWYSFVAVRGP